MAKMLELTAIEDKAERCVWLRVTMLEGATASRRQHVIKFHPYGDTEHVVSGLRLMADTVQRHTRE